MGLTGGKDPKGTQTKTPFRDLCLPDPAESNARAAQSSAAGSRPRGVGCKQVSTPQPPTLALGVGNCSRETVQPIDRLMRLACCSRRHRRQRSCRHRHRLAPLNSRRRYVTSMAYQLWAAPVCPFAQRAWIAAKESGGREGERARRCRLVQKRCAPACRPARGPACWHGELPIHCIIVSAGAPFEYKAVDLHNKSPEFEALYRWAQGGTAWGRSLAAQLGSQVLILPSHRLLLPRPSPPPQQGGVRRLRGGQGAGAGGRRAGDYREPRGRRVHPAAVWGPHRWVPWALCIVVLVARRRSAPCSAAARSELGACRPASAQPSASRAACLVHRPRRRHPRGRRPAGPGPAVGRRVVC